jgi:hypothetical protein
MGHMGKRRKWLEGAQHRWLLDVETDAGNDQCCECEDCGASGWKEHGIDGYVIKKRMQVRITVGV